MAEISFAACASHAPGLAGWFDKAPEDAPLVDEAYRRLHEEFVSSGTDQEPRATVRALGLDGSAECDIAGESAARLLGGRLLEPTT